MSDLSPTTIPELAPGWTPERKLQFLDHLAGRGNVRASCRRVGLSREAAYRLRRRDPQSARGWAAALVLARSAGSEVLADRAIDGVEEDIWYRGELVGTRRKFDTRLLLAHLGRLDKAADDKAAAKDAERFDELLALIGEAPVTQTMSTDCNAQPINREEYAHEAAEAAGAKCQADTGRTGEGPAEELRVTAVEQARVQALARWDGWFADICDYVDYVAGLADNGREKGGPEFSPRTVSDVSTGAMAVALAGGAAGGLGGDPPSSP